MKNKSNVKVWAILNTGFEVKWDRVSIEKDGVTLVLNDADFREISDTLNGKRKKLPIGREMESYHPDRMIMFNHASSTHPHTQDVSQASHPPSEAPPADTQP